MSLGQVTQQVEYSKGPLETLADLERAWNLIGSVQSVDRTAHSITGKTRYGLQTVKMQAFITGSETASRIQVTALSDDVGGVGAKDGVRRLFEALHNVDNPDYKPNKTGLSSTRLVLRIVLFLAVFFVVYWGLVSGSFPPWLVALLCVLGAGVFIYFLVANRTFGKK
jgi:hypothetical protein